MASDLEHRVSRTKQRPNIHGSDSLPPTQKPLLRARFSEIVALNFPISPKILINRLPDNLELDFYQSETYVSLVAMVLRNVRVYGIPIHIAGGFGELNLRFYVKRKDGSQWKRGACFIKDYVSSATAAWILGSLFKADFSRLPMKSSNFGFRSKDPTVAPTADYRWNVGDEPNRIRVRGRKLMSKTGPGTKVGFILEHANEYSSRDGQTFEYIGTRPEMDDLGCGPGKFPLQCQKTVR